MCREMLVSNTSSDATLPSTVLGSEMSSASGGETLSSAADLGKASADSHSSTTRMVERPHCTFDRFLTIEQLENKVEAMKERTHTLV